MRLVVLVLALVLSLPATGFAAGETVWGQPLPLGDDYDWTGVHTFRNFNTSYHFADSYASGSSTAGMQEAIDACGSGSTEDDQGCVIVMPCGTRTITSTIYVGGLTLATMQNAIRFQGCGAGFESSLGDKLSGTTLVWGGSNGGTMLQVTGTNHVLEDFLLDGNDEAGYGIVQVSDNSASSPSGKNIYRNISIEDVLDTTNGATGWGFSFGTVDGSEQNDFTMIDQITIRNSRHCLQQLDDQAVQNEIRMFNCTRFTSSPAINIQRGGINFDEVFLRPASGNDGAVGIQVDNCATVFEMEDGSIEWPTDNGTVVRMTNASGLCTNGNSYKHRIENVRFQMQATATVEHTCIEKDSKASLTLIDNTWTSTNGDALRKCDIELDNPDSSRETFVHMFGNRSAWSNGADVSSISITLNDTGGAGNTLIRFDDMSGDFTWTGTHTFSDSLYITGGNSSCIMLRDSDDAGYSECEVLNGTLSCATDADGVCDGTL